MQNVNSTSLIVERESQIQIINRPPRELPEGFAHIKALACTSALRVEIQAGNIPGYRIDRKTCVRLSDYHAWIERARRVQPRGVTVESSDPRDQVVFRSRGVK